jgi:hypothetical protein
MSIDKHMAYTIDKHRHATGDSESHSACSDATGDSERHFSRTEDKAAVEPAAAHAVEEAKDVMNCGVSS